MSIIYEKFWIFNEQWSEPFVINFTNEEAEEAENGCEDERSHFRLKFSAYVQTK